MNLFLCVHLIIHQPILISVPYKKRQKKNHFHSVKKVFFHFIRTLLLKTPMRLWGFILRYHLRVIIDLFIYF